MPKVAMVAIGIIALLLVTFAHPIEGNTLGFCPIFKSPLHAANDALVDLIRIGGQVKYAFLSSSSSSSAVRRPRSVRPPHRSRIDYAAVRRSNAAGLIWPRVEWRRFAL